MKTVCQSDVTSIFTARKMPQGNHFAVITRRNSEWFNPSMPASRIQIVGFFNDSAELVDSTSELMAMANREIQECGEFADHLASSGKLDFISLRPLQ